MILSSPSPIQPEFEDSSFRKFALVSSSSSSDRHPPSTPPHHVEHPDLSSLKLLRQMTPAGSSKFLFIFASALYQLSDDINFSFPSQRELMSVLNRIFSRLDGQLTLTRGEAVVALCILLNFVFRTSKEEDTSKRKALLNRHNYGTVLVVSLLVTLKLMRDTPPRNSWWCDIYCLPLHTVCESEIALLNQADFHLFPNADLFLFLSRIISN
ncbi:hypothetical protein BLNAU_1250 [Blattamonas nauphoetae]|uniref:Cyclin N-terminal domain-containing protein n=1 Tax=Blattamonas nauphoetae TaxID=2049346 RepID=A0ABQ9YIV1_9EUKA|nr:hypothetical protein BLNAU_1250 [Blattamonas nauphoetae]